MKFHKYKVYSKLISKRISKHKESITNYVAFFIFVLIGAVILNYFISPFFITPLERAVLSSNTQLKREHDKLSKAYNEIEEVVRDIKQRDKIIYEQLFGLERPYTYIEDNSSKEQLKNLTFIELFTKLENANSNLVKEIDTTSAILKSAIKGITDKKFDFKAIPSIQPISNKNLEINIVPAGMCINPFLKSFYLHKGIDYSLPEGSKVFATADGTVSSFMSNGSEGGTVTIRHKYFFTTSYANLSICSVAIGRKVKRGQLIGYSGNTGTSFLPHLHYEIKYKGRNLDPFDFFYGELTVDEMKTLRVKSAQNIQSFD